jgi:hypothetical protein
VESFALAFGALGSYDDLATDFRLAAPVAGSVTLRRPVWASCRRHSCAVDCESESSDETSGENPSSFRRTCFLGFRQLSLAIIVEGDQ